MVTCTPNDLASSAKAFTALSAAESLAIQTYQTAVLAFGSLSPASLLISARAFLALDVAELLAMSTQSICGFYSFTSGFTCTAQNTINNAEVFTPLERKEMVAAELWLWTVVNNTSSVPATLLSSAKAFMALDYKSHLAIQCYCLCTSVPFGPTCTPAARAITARDYCKFSDLQLAAARLWLLCQIGSAFNVPITPTGFNFTISTDGQTITASWNATPAGVTKTEVWTSTDNVTFALETTVVAPGVSTTSFTKPAANGTKYAKIRWVNNNGNGSFTAVQSVLYTYAMEWATRVIANGGATPAVANIQAMDTFANSMVSAGIWSQLIIFNVIAPDSLIAAKTPFIRGPGSALWTGTGTLSVNGWITTTVSLHTGFNPSTGGLSQTSACWIAYIYNGVQTSATTACLGCRVTASTQYYMCNPNSANLWYGWCFSNDGSSLLGQGIGIPHPNGLWALTRRSNTILEAYRGQATFAPGTMELMFSTAVAGSRTPPSAEYYVGGENLDGVDTVDTVRTISIWGAATGMTGADLQTLYVAATLLRQAFGGGWV